MPSKAVETSKTDKKDTKSKTTSTKTSPSVVRSAAAKQAKTAAKPAVSKSTKTSTVRSTASKSVAKPKTAGKASTASEKKTTSASVKVVPVASALDELKKKELVEKAVAKSGVSKKYVKPALEAMIDVLGEAFAEGREINLQPFGKIKQQRVKETQTARIAEVRIRQSKVAIQAASSVQEDAGSEHQSPVANAAE